MGFRAHVRTRSLIDYGMEGFNHLQYELAGFITEHCEDSYLYDDNDWCRNDWEINRDQFKEMVKYIEENYEDGEQVLPARFGEGYTKENILYIFNAWLEQTEDQYDFTYPGYIYIDWF